MDKPEVRENAELVLVNIDSQPDVDECVALVLAYRQSCINEGVQLAKKAMLKQLMSVRQANGYPDEAVSKSTILSLEALVLWESR